jgi:Cys-tRNA synthase (O-phospho-L-seryl-tRNA:Cys-tRNA synthase)
MNTLFALIVFAAVIIIAISVFNLMGKGKSHTEKTSMEKISSTIAEKLNRSVDNLADGMRNLEAIKDEILSKLDEAKTLLRNDYKNYLTSMVTARETYEKVISTTESRIPSIESKAKSYKTKYEKSQDERDKEYAYKYLTQLISMNKIKESAMAKLNKIKADIEDAQTIYDLESISLEDKRLEIISMTCAPDSTNALASFNISDLVQEFKDKLEKKQIDTEVDKMMETSTNTDPTNQVSLDELNEAFNGL